VLAVARGLRRSPGRAKVFIVLWALEISQVQVIELVIDSDRKNDLIIRSILAFALGEGSAVLPDEACKVLVPAALNFDEDTAFLSIAELKKSREDLIDLVIIYSIAPIRWILLFIA